MKKVLTLKRSKAEMSIVYEADLKKNTGSTLERIATIAIPSVVIRFILCQKRFLDM